MDSQAISGETRTERSVVISEAHGRHGRSWPGIEKGMQAGVKEVASKDM